MESPMGSPFDKHPEPGQVPWLLDLLHTKWMAAERPARTVEDFLAFCREYMGNNRTVRQGPADRNVMLTLADGTQALVHPGTSLPPGAIEPAGDVPITPGL